MLLAAAGGLRTSDDGPGKSAGEPGYQRPSGPPRARTFTDLPCRLTTLRGTMAERRILETTQLFAAPARRHARSPPAAGDDPHGRPQRGAVPPGRRRQRAVRASSGGRIAILDPVPRRARVDGRGARRGRRCSASSASSTTARARPTPGRSRRPRVIVLDYEAVRAAIDAHPSCSGSSCALLARRLRATDEALADAVFLDVPGPHREAAARARGRRRRVPAAR